MYGRLKVEGNDFLKKKKKKTDKSSVPYTNAWAKNWAREKPVK